jgi:hypothetical protein
VTEQRNTPRALLDQMGGVSGLIYSSLPVLAFVPMNTLFGLKVAIIAALGVASLILAWRQWRRDTVQPAVSGFIGVGISAGIAYWAGESRAFFLPGIWLSLLYATVFAVSVLIRRPIVGYVWGWFKDHDAGWRRVRKALWAYNIATLIWVAVFLSRFLVQNYLYGNDETGWLGFARIAMGWPLAALAALVMIPLIRAAQHAVHEAARDRDGAQDPGPAHSPE